MKRIGDWIQTFHGVAFYPIDPRPDEILVEDIAHALSMQCRFTGHVRRFYSVAEHSVHVSQACYQADALWGLLHDASEAYLVDVASPVKRMEFMEPYRGVEGHLMRSIADRFGLNPRWPEPDNVKRADKCLLAIEARDLMPTVWPDWRERWYPFIGENNLIITRPWSPEEAEERFLDRFAELTASAHVSLVDSVKQAAAVLGRWAAQQRKGRPISAQREASAGTPAVQPPGGLFDAEEVKVKEGEAA